MTPRLFPALLLLATLAGTTAHAQTRAITHEDLWLMPRVGAPVASPDGRWVVLSVVEPAYAPDQQTTDLWLVPSDGSAAPRRLTATRAPETGMAWSSDSRRLAFSTRRDGDTAAQIYVIDVDRPGEAQRATQISTGARMPQFSPDGRYLLFTSNVHPDSRNDADSRRIAEEQKARLYSARVYTGFPIRNWDRWLDGTQPRLFVQAIGSSEALDLLAGSTLVAGPGFDGRTTPGGSELEATWAPDGQSVVFVASDNRHQSAWSFTHTDLWQVPAGGGEPLFLQRVATHKDRGLLAVLQRLRHTVHSFG